MMTRVIEFLRSVTAAILACFRWKHVGSTQGVLPCLAPDDLPEWDADDRGALLAFLRTPTGRTLLLWLRHSEELLKATACDAAQSHVDHARGRAVGYREAIASLILLSAPEEGADESGDETSAEDFLVETPVRGAAALRNQLSHES